MSTPDTLLSDTDLRSSVRALPALAAVVRELLELLGREDVSAETLARCIAHDQAITAKTLRLANSSFYGMPRQVDTVTEAIAVLGMRTVRSVVTAAALTGSFKRSACEGFEFTAFWRHSIATAISAKLLADNAKLDGEAAFTAGLLHDIGQLLLATCHPEACARALRHRTEHDAPLLAAEHAVFGHDHAEAGALLAEHWRFSPLLVDAIRRHHQPTPPAGKSLASLLHVADNIAHALDLAHLESDAVPALDPLAWLALGLDAAACGALFGAIETQTQAVCDALLN